MEETTETVVESSEGGVGTFLTGLKLECPYTNVDGEFERGGSL